MEIEIARGAEAIILRKGNEVIKRRIKKSYRIAELDEKLRTRRTRSEAKIMQKSTNIIGVPKILKVDEKEKEIAMDFIDGKKLADFLDNLQNAIEICKQIGEETAKLHDADIIHGDLTTSNMLLREGKKVYFIDFGLSFFSSRIEDKAVDLHLLKEALESKHFKKWQAFFDACLEGYKISKNYSAVLKQLEKVEKRGRYKNKA